MHICIFIGSCSSTVVGNKVIAALSKHRRRCSLISCALNDNFQGFFKQNGCCYSNSK